MSTILIANYNSLILTSKNLSFYVLTPSHIKQISAGVWMYLFKLVFGNMIYTCKEIDLTVNQITKCVAISIIGITIFPSYMLFQNLATLPIKILCFLLLNPGRPAGLPQQTEHRGSNTVWFPRLSHKK